MSQENLHKIFRAAWFASGRGERTAEGKHWSFQPHMYWLPLLAIFSGGRLNELSQLHLDDIQQTAGGQWLIDFNLNAPDKLDLDEPDKRLKNVNSIRKVPVHSFLAGLGLTKYVAALRDAGHTRVFPELRLIFTA